MNEIGQQSNHWTPSELTVKNKTVHLQLYLVLVFHWEAEKNDLECAARNTASRQNRLN